MSKLLDKNGLEMANALVSLAKPIKNFLEDKEFLDAFEKCTRNGVVNKMHSIAQVYVDLIPILLGDKHVKDTLAIVAVVEGTSVKKLLDMNGTEMLADCVQAWREQIGPFFTQLGLTV